MDISLRLNKMAQKDKQNNPKYLIDVIKSDFFYLISNYFEVEFNSIDVDVKLENNFYLIKLTCVGDRPKNLRALP